MVIVGESGSGKSTLLKAAGGLLEPGLAITSGSISFQGTLCRTHQDWQKRYGTEIGFLYQDAAASFCPVKTIRDQLWDAAHFAGSMDYPTFSDLAQQRASVLGLPASSLDSYPQELSGGMIQRAELLFSLILAPTLLLADEPTSAVDNGTQQKIADAILRLRRYHHTAIMLVTHDIRLAAYMADTILVLKAGRVIEYGSAAAIKAKPQQAYTRQLFQLAYPRKDS